MKQAGNSRPTKQLFNILFKVHLHPDSDLDSMQNIWYERHQKGVPMVLQLVVECEFSRFLYVHKSGFVETINVLWDHGHEKCLKLKRHFHPSGYVTDII